MEELFSGVEMWSWYSEEKGMNFNGYLIEAGKERVVIDPPQMTIDDKQDLSINGVKAVILTNRDHIREAMECRLLLNTKIWAPEADAAEMGAITIDHTFKDGDTLPAGLRVISISNGKSPGESALFLDQRGGVMILGDALIGLPDGTLSLLPPEKYADIKKAKEGLRRLLDYEFEIVLVGDGKPILSGGKKAVEAFLNRG
jgi:glyoxylase-like metal-dependent hydrolase (beta-lactamase superfamily II)